MAWNLDTEWDTASNRAAERGSDISDRFNDPKEMPDLSMPPDAPLDPEAPPPPPEYGSEEDVLRLFKSAYTQGVQHRETHLQARWSQSYNAWNNEHSPSSKYRSARYRGRTRLFRPKTRSAVRRKQAEAAAALFATQDSIIVSAANANDDMQLASAAIVQELVNFRLDRSNENAGIPWFMVTMGAHQTAQQTAICISKQYWEYKQEADGFDIVPPPMLPLGPGGAMVTFGEPQQVPRMKTVRDRPRIRLIPPEDVIRDPAASWEDQAQDSSYIILCYPMTVADALQFVGDQNQRSAIRFKDDLEGRIKAAAGHEGDGATSGSPATVRNARETNKIDRYNDSSVDKEFQIVWLHEAFMRIAGKEYVYWTLGRREIISNIVPLIEAYPEQGGARPITIGVGALEPFKVDPMSPIESWQPLQQEINDVVNLRLDTTKQTIAPLAIVRKGRGVDVKAVQNRSPDSVVYVQEAGDLTFDRPGDVAQSAYVEMERLNADFDDQAGAFSGGSVQTNRSLNETVGGMQLLASSANALGEFDLRVWIETWVEPVLRQLVKLEQYYETDANILALAGEKAQIFQKFNINQITDELLTQQVTIICNVGIGSADPMMSMQKFGQAIQLAAGASASPLATAMKMDAVIDEIFGKAGFKNASERFFDFEAQDPRMMQMQQQMEMMQQEAMAGMEQMQQQMQEMQAKLQQAEVEKASKTEQIDADMQKTLLQVQADKAKSASEIKARKDIAKLNALTQLAGKEMAKDGQREAQINQLMAEEQSAEREQMMMEQDVEPDEGVHEMLGLKQPDVAAAIAPLAQAIMEGMSMLAQQIGASQQQTAAMIADQNQQQAQSMQMIAQTISDGNAATQQALGDNALVQSRATQELTAAIRAPKKIQRGPDGFATSISS